jgi:hypothetical protein
MGILVSNRPKPSAAPASASRAVKPAPEPERDRPPVLLYAGLAALSLVVLVGAVWVVVAHQRAHARPATVALNEAPAPPQPEAAPAKETPETPHEGPAPPAPAPAAAPAPAPAPPPAAPPEQRPAEAKDPLAGYVPPSKAGSSKTVAVPPSLKAPGEGDWDSGLSPEAQERVNKAIDQGVAHLKRRVTGGDPLMGRTGYQALVGLTLLACGVPADDPAVRSLVGLVRGGADAEQKTYDLALSIMFLDRLGEPADHEVIRTLGLRLVAGQNGSGGWSYQCPPLRGSDRDQLLDLLEALSPPPRTGAAGPGMRTGTNKPEPGRVQAPAASAPRDDDPSPFGPRKPLGGGLRRMGNRQAISGPVKNLPVIRFKPGDKPNFQDFSDNSNTQFAVLALWVARKYGVPVDRTAALVDARFRASQHNNGSWSYNPLAENWPDSMTCSGLIGLAVARGTVRGDDAGKASARDPDIARGLRYLGGRLGESVRKARLRSNGGSGHIIHADAHGDLYFLWSVERVAVVYDLRTIGGKDWYAWGAPIIVDHQQPDGSWHDVHETADTCFALLFLKRVNVAQDLTATLRSFDNLVDQADGGRIGRVPSK